MKIVVSLLVVVLLGAAALHGCEPSRGAALPEGYAEMHAELSKLPTKLSVFALGWGEIEGWSIGFKGWKLG